MITMTNDEIWIEYCDMSAKAKTQTAGTIARLRAEGPEFRQKVLTALQKAAHADNRSLFVCLAIAILETRPEVVVTDEQIAKAIAEGDDDRAIDLLLNVSDLTPVTPLLRACIDHARSGSLYMRHAADEATANTGG